MDTEKLKQKILDLAIRGKLVPQDPNDESAEELIKRIQEEKAKLVKEGKIKASKEESVIFKGSDNCYYEKIGNEIKKIDDEIPFEIPNNWCWVRMPSIGIVKSGLTYDPKDISDCGTPVLRSPNINNGKIVLNEIIKVKKTIRDNQYMEQNDILICARNGSKALVGKCAIFNINESTQYSFGAFMMSFKTPFYKYIYYYLNSNLFRSLLNKDDTKQINQVTLSTLRKTLVPLPPLSEQERITNLLTNSLNSISNICTDTDEIKEIVSVIKKKVLENVFSTNSSYKSYYENEYFLGDLLPYEQPALYIVKSTNYDDKYDTPVLTPGKSFILGYTNEKEGVYHVNNSKVIIFDDFTTASRIIDFDFKVKSSAMKILKSSDETKFNIDYLFFLLQSLYVNNDTHKRYWISEFATKKVKVHTFEEQLKIVKNINEFYDILDSIL